jgi:hypothetical protein
MAIGRFSLLFGIMFASKQQEAIAKAVLAW